jgi:hypothetical protein
MPACQHDGMDEVKLTIRLSTDDRRALKLHAVAQGRSIQDLVTELIHAELAKGAAPAGRMSREEFVADLYARRGIDPTSSEHQAIEKRARASVRGAEDRSDAADGGKRGMA